MAVFKRHTKPHRAQPGTVTSENITLDEAQLNDYAAQAAQGHGLDPRARTVFIICVVFLCVYAAGIIVPKDMLNEALHYAGYNQGYSLAWFVQSLQENVAGLAALLTGSAGSGSPVGYQMLLYVIVALTGAGMALSGAVYQGSFKNELVTPSALGVMGGSTLGMAVFIALFVRDDGSGFAGLRSLFTGAGTGDALAGMWASYGLALCSFAGCLLVVGLVVFTMRVFNRGQMSGIGMILTGQVVGAVCGGIVNIVRYYFVYTNPEGAQAYALQQIQVSTFYRHFTLVDVVAILVPVLACFALIMSLNQKMMLLTLSEDEARALGADTGWIKVVLVGACTLLTAIIVSFCGHTGFIGFLAPHIARRLVGPNFKYLLPASMAVGAVFVLASYVLVQMTLGPAYETVAGVFISIFGACVFLFTAIRSGGGERSEFR
ncbi:MAG: FecCD family ABC transporter permease [Coriobacteriales bacterium]